MKIFKKWQRFFSQEDIEVEPLDEWTNDAEESEPLHTKPKFRFPLISDEERTRILNGEVPQTTSNREIEEDVQPLYMHEKWRRDRENTVVHTATGNRQSRPKVDSPKEIISEPIKTEQEVTSTNRRYTPSKFASPVYGYTQKQKKDEWTEPSVEEITNDLERFETEVVTFAEEVAAAAIQTSDVSVEETIEDSPFYHQQLTSETQIESKNIENERELEDVQIEQAEQPVITEQVEQVEQPAQLEPPSSGQAVEREEKKSSRTTPFNVLMLKSDRKKMERATLPSVEKPAVKNEKSEQAIPAYNTKSNESYMFPSLEYLLPPERKLEDREWMASQAAKLEEALSYFQVKGKVIHIMQGPSVTQFELTVGHGTKVSKIRNLTDDLKLALAAKDIRIQAPIPGKSSIGIEIPNRVARPVRISEIIGSPEFKNSESPLEAVLGLDLTGKPATIDLRKMPHGLIAGATGSGKSVSINSILVSLLYKSAPEDLRLLLIDPKVVELAPYNHIPHLISPVITDVKAANAALKWAVEEMERRYQLFAHTGVRDISRYNSMAIDKGQYALKLPYILIVIDELADLMMMAPAEVEESISRIAQKARACGIHLIIATQRPSVDVITGLIKANIPTRIAFSVSSQIDSRTIIDIVGAERLLGKGDMLYLGNGMSAPARLQGTYVSDDEIERVVAHVREQAEPDYFFQQEELIKRSDSIEEKDELFEEACRFIVESGNASTSLLQRKFHIGYNRAARLIDQLEENGFISEQNGSKPREVYLTEPELSGILDG
ncbi:DNA translocase FtsK [Chungangia koreensis]|uniref:DNA translocase FtsK n=1 Tax=Chungangia koreensis TaxID=752657 RepID=A0ABV8X3P5_9LACT